MEGLAGEPRLVGREVELAQLEGALADATKSASVVAVEGEPGIGKSSLLRELATLADGRKCLVLEGRATEIERNVPFAVFIDALDDYLASLNPRSFDFADASGRAALGRIFPALGEFVADSPEPAQEERYRLHAAARRMLEWLARRRPTVVALDDLHWADEASLELVSYLLRHPPAAPLMIAVASRSGQAPRQLEDALAEAVRHGSLLRIELAPLNRSEAEEMIGVGSPPEHHSRLYEVTGGNPFYLEQLARSWEGGEAPDDPVNGGAPGAAVPDLVTGAIARELADLDEPSEGLLRGGAVLGEGFEPDLAAKVGAIGDADPLTVLDGLLARDLVRPTDSPRRFRFRHPIVRQAVYEAAPAGWRLGAHERAAAELGRRGAAPASRAHHLERSASPGDEEAITVLTETATAIAAGAPAAAAYWYGSALRLLSDEDPGRRLAVLVPMAHALAASGSYDESLEAIGEIHDLLPEDAPGLRARIVVSAAEVKHMVGRPREARAELEGALGMLEDRASADASAVKLHLAGDCFYRGDFDALESWVREALGDAEARNDRPGAAAATGLLAASQYMSDQIADAHETMDTAVALLPELGDDELAADLNAYSYTALGAVCLERFDDAYALLERTIRVALATGHGHLAALMRTTRAFAALYEGKVAAADADLDAAVEASILTRNPIFLCWALTMKSWVSLIRGEVSEAARIAERAIAAVEDSDDPVTATSAIYLGDALLASGEAERARDSLLEYAGGPGLPRVERGTRARAYEILTRAELDRGDQPAAEKWVQLAEKSTEGLGIEGRTADAARARAAYELAGGDIERAAAAAREAIAAAQNAGLAIEAERAAIILGRALAAGGVEEAAAVLEGSRATLAELGAEHYANQASRELRRMGIRVSRRSARKGDVGGNGIPALSERELEIAQLVAAGQRNREIAESLFLSVRTVEGHLRRIFGKLEITSRTQLATMMREGSG